jgi:hypothetical protein
MADHPTDLIERRLDVLARQRVPRVVHLGVRGPPLP